MEANTRKFSSEIDLIELKLVLETEAIALIEAKILVRRGSPHKIVASRSVGSRKLLLIKTVKFLIPEKIIGP